MAIGGNANASKRKFAVAGAVLLVLAVLVALFAGGTFAKYVTEDDGSDTARVAKWGVVIEGADEEGEEDNGGINDMFDISYTKGDVYAGLTKSVVISGDPDENVLAPGTGKTYEGIKVTGEPEVAVKVGTKAEVDLGNNWVDENNKFYCPLVFTIGSETICGLKYSGGSDRNGGKDGFETAIEDAIEKQAAGGSKISYSNNSNDGFYYVAYEAGTVLDNQGITTAITWDWPFEDSDHENCLSTHESDQCDVDDTYLANWAERNGDEPKITITLTTTVTQIN